MTPRNGMEEVPTAARLATMCPGIRHTALDRLTEWVLCAPVIPLALATVTFLVFSPTLLNGFVRWDDHVNLFENASYRGLGLKQLRWMFTTTLMGHYIPVSWLTFGLDYSLWGMNPLGYHLTSNLIHAANAALFYLVALRLLRKAAALEGTALRLGSATAALFFALHPLRAESVAWATERRDVLAGFFFFLTVLMYLGASEATRHRRHRLLMGSIACYLLALLSKSIVMTLPLLLILLDVYPLRRLSFQWGTWRNDSARAVLKEKLPYLALGLGGGITAYWAVASHHYLTNVAKFGWAGRIAVAGYGIWFYLEKTVVPLSLSPLYELPAVVNVLEPRFLSSMVAVVAISLAALALCRRWPAGLAVWVYYGILLAPVSGIVHSGYQLAHDRYSYLSCLGWALLVGAAVGSIGRAAATGALRPGIARLAGVVAAVWVLALANLTWHQIQVWRDTETLWNFAVESDPQCSICQSNLGTSLYHRKLFALAKERYDLALALRPDRTRVHGNLGPLLQSMGDSVGAIRHLNIALAWYPDDPAVLDNAAFVLVEQKRYLEAIPYLERAIRTDPDYVPALINLGAALGQVGKADVAIPYLLRAREIRPDEPNVHLNLARAYASLGRYEAARKEYDNLVALDASFAREIPADANLRQ
ncbi:MAG TPA: tetratricopeptide repeat protein [Candidatus Methylomirabilis sp.]|nr:tetratricopeptide repeat protein [Candidatus Methylomirabilis sp.]